MKIITHTHTHTRTHTHTHTHTHTNTHTHTYTHIRAHTHSHEAQSREDVRWHFASAPSFHGVSVCTHNACTHARFRNMYHISRSINGHTPPAPSNCYTLTKLLYQWPHTPCAQQLLHTHQAAVSIATHSLANRPIFKTCVT